MAQVSFEIACLIWIFLVTEVDMKEHSHLKRLVIFEYFQL